MAIGKKNKKQIDIITTLGTKQATLLDTVEDDKDTIVFLRSQIAERESSAALAAKQATAVEEATKILEAAGVTLI